MHRLVSTLFALLLASHGALAHQAEGEAQKGGSGEAQPLALCDNDWACMTRELKQLDVAFTAECKRRKVAVAEISDDQRARYRSCVEPDRVDLADCAVLSRDPKPLSGSCP